MVHSVGLSQRFRLRAGIDLAASILMAAAAMVLIWRATSAPTNTEPTLVVPSEAISIAETPTMGDESAPVVMIEYSDFQCPFCSRFATQVLPELRHEYVSKGALRLAFKHLPLAIHPLAVPAAQVADCAAQQGQFWAVHDLLFSQPAQRFVVSDAIAQGRALAGDPESFDSCMKASPSESIDRDRAEAERFGISSTPYFLLGRVQEDGRIRILTALKGAGQVAEFQRAIRRVLDEAKSSIH